MMQSILHLKQQLHQLDNQENYGAITYRLHVIVFVRVGRLPFDLGLFAGRQRRILLTLVPDLGQLRLPARRLPTQEEVRPLNSGLVLHS